MCIKFYQTSLENCYMVPKRRCPLFRQNLTSWARPYQSIAKIAMNQLVPLLRKRQILICCRQNTWKEDMTEDGKSKELGHFQDLVLNPTPIISQLFDLGKDAWHLCSHSKMWIIIQNLQFIIQNKSCKWLCCPKIYTLNFWPPIPLNVCIFVRSLRKWLH